VQASRRLRYLKHRLPTWCLWSTALAVLGFLYLPVIVIVVQSFNASSILSLPITQWTIAWYPRAAHDPDIVMAAKNSLLVAGVSIMVALLVGIPAAFGIDRFNFKGKRALQWALYIPFLLPGVITGIALLTLFLNWNVTLSLKTIMAGHITMLIPLATVLTAASLARWDRELESAAMDLGASEIRTFIHVTLPNLRSTIAGIVLLGMTFSLDEVTRTFFLAGTENTLPIQIWAMLKRGITPEVNAIATVILTVSVVTIGIWSRLSKDVI
jgi:spermidine/putrescine transport system permease protein